MQPYHMALAGAAAVALALSWRTPRAKLWVGCLAASYLASLGYLYLDKPSVGVWWPPQSGFVFLCDAAVILAIWHWGQDRWEHIGLRMVMMLSATLDLSQTFGEILGYPPALPQRTFGIALEVINYIALLMIAGVGLFDLIEARHGNPKNAFYRLINSVVRTACAFAHKKVGPQKPFSKW